MIINKELQLGLSVFTVLAVLTSCSPNIPNNNILNQNVSTNSNIKNKYSINGTVEFPNSYSPPAPLLNKREGGKNILPLSRTLERGQERVSSFKTKATLGDVGTMATVSILYPPDDATNPNVTIATGLTDASGVFAINPDGSFNPSPGDIFVLEASKRIGRAGNDVITVSTYIQRNATDDGWDSITYPGLFINSKTTALTIIDSYDTSLSSSDCISSINVTSSGSTPDATIGSVTSATVLKVFEQVNNLLVQNVDPLKNISYNSSSGKFYVNTEINHASIAVSNGLDCPECDLKNEDLSSQDLTGLDLSNTDFTNTNLTNTDFTGGDLTGATLTGANLSGATWTDGSYCRLGSVGSCLPVLGEFHVNTYTNNYQQYSSVAMDGDGDFIVTWASNYQTGDINYGIFGQRYKSDGTTNGTEFHINTYTNSNQLNPSVAMDDDGDFIVTWESNNQTGDLGYGIFGQRYASTGSATGSEFHINTYTNSYQRYPSVAMDDDGDFIVTWQSANQTGDGIYGIFGQRYASTGSATGSEFHINTYTNDNQRYPSVAMDGDGDFIVTWQSHNQTGDIYYGIFGQRYKSDGTTNGIEFHINTYTNAQQQNSSVAMDDDGDFIVTWESNNQTGDLGYGIFGQRYASTGSATGSEFHINTETNSYQLNPSVAMDGDGDFIVTWLSFYQTGEDYSGVFGQRYNNLGVGQ